jgi:hypothetical protein
MSAAPIAPVKPKFIYLPVVGRGEQIHLLLAEHGMEVDFVLPAGFGGEYVWADQAAHGTLPSFETIEEDKVSVGWCEASASNSITSTTTYTTTYTTTNTTTKYN